MLEPETITPFNFGEETPLRKELGKIYKELSKKNQLKGRISSMESFLEIIDIVKEMLKSSNSSEQVKELGSLEKEMNRHQEIHNWKKRMGYAPRTNHEEYDLQELEYDLQGLEGEARNRIFEITIAEFETAVDRSAPGAYSTIRAIKLKAKNMKRRNQIRLLAQNPLPPKFDPNEEILESNRFFFAFANALIMKLSMKSDNQILEKIEQLIEMVSNPKSRKKELSLFKEKLYEIFGSVISELGKEFDLIGEFWDKLGIKEMSREELILTLRTMKGSYSSPSKQPVDNRQVSKTETPKIVNSDQEVAFTTILAKYITETGDRIRFNDWLLKNANPSEPIKFNGNATQLVHAFKTLFDHGLLNARYRKEVQQWIVNHFQFLDGEKPTPFLDDYVKKLLSKKSKAPLYPILEVTNGHIVPPKPLDEKKSAKNR